MAYDPNDPEGRGQAEPLPGAEPDGGVGDGAEPQFDPASQIVEVAGRKMTVASLMKSYPEVEKTLRRVANENDQLKGQLGKLGWAPELERLMTENPDVREQLESLIVEKGSRVPEGIDPIARKVNEIDSKLDALRARDALGAIERQHGMQLSDEQREDIFLYMRANGVRDVNAAFWAIHGPGIAQEREEKAKKEIVAAIERNKKAIPRVPKGSVGAGKADITKMSPDQFDAHVLKIIEEAHESSGE